jgi:polyisoprenoid-binding protein YceI
MRARHSHRATLLAAALLSLLPAAGHAQDRARVRLEGGASDFLRFQLRSVKAGFIGTSVDGHVRDFEVSYERVGDGARDVRVTFPVRAMTTGDGGRDAKMWSYCLDAEHHPRVEIEIPGRLGATFSGEVPARMRVRGSWRPIRVQLTARRAGASTVVEGRARVSLAQLGVPDPSIWIARVEDAVTITFRAHVAREVQS